MLIHKMTEYEKNKINEIVNGMDDEEKKFILHTILENDRSMIMEAWCILNSLPIINNSIKE